MLEETDRRTSTVRDFLLDDLLTFPHALYVIAALLGGEFFALPRRRRAVSDLR
ncbi:MAG: hypothetical protein GY925_14965 [Actinomycetia bacterium]|nr:hypothetical protein [Actinomycetes bacterium]